MPSTPDGGYLLFCGTTPAYGPRRYTVVAKGDRFGISDRWSVDEQTTDIGGYPTYDEALAMADDLERQDGRAELVTTRRSALMRVVHRRRARTGSATLHGHLPPTHAPGDSTNILIHDHPHAAGDHTGMDPEAIVP